MRSIGDLFQVVGSGLVDIIIEPVGIEELGGGTPADDRGAGGVVLSEVVFRYGDIQPLVDIPEIFIGQGVRVILRVSGDKEAPIV